MEAVSMQAVERIVDSIDPSDEKEYPPCANCGEPVRKHLFPSRRRKDLLWCSFDCYKKKPRRVVLLELEYGEGAERKDIKDILIETTKKYGNHNAQAKALGVSVPYFFMMIERYFFVSMDKFMLEHATGARLKRYQAAQERKKLKKQKVAEAASKKRG